MSCRNVELMSFDNKIIELWMIIYDQDYDRIYFFTNFDQIIASVESSIRGYLCDDPICDDVCVKISKSIRRLKNRQCVIPMVIDKLQISIYRLELDKATRIHQLLAKCHEHVPDKLQSEITSIFNDIT